MPELTVGCGQAKQAVSIATRPLGCSGRDCEMTMEKIEANLESGEGLQLPVKDAIFGSSNFA